MKKASEQIEGIDGNSPITYFGELPLPTKLFGKPSWTVDCILSHLKNRLANTK